MPTTTNPRLGTYLTTSTAGENVRAFVPPALPPDPPLDISPELHDLLEKANRGLGRLDGVARLFPDPDLFLYMYVRKEALLSSQIEGTQSSFSDLLLFENKEVPGVPLDDVKEVSNYVAAMNHGLERLRGGFPLSLRLLKEMHGILLSKGRGHTKAPGEFRTSQNWIGGSRPGNAAFVPPPPNKVMECMGALEKFLHDDPVKTPLLVKAALATDYGFGVVATDEEDDAPVSTPTGVLDSVQGETAHREQHAEKAGHGDGIGSHGRRRCEPAAERAATDLFALRLESDAAGASRTSRCRQDRETANSARRWSSCRRRRRSR